MSRTGALLLGLLLVAPSAAFAGGPHEAARHAAAHHVAHHRARVHRATTRPGCQKPPTAVEAVAVKVAEAGWKAKSAHDKAVGLSILARIHGRCEKAKIAKALEAPDPELRTAAVNAAAEVGVYRAWARKVAKPLLAAHSPWLRVQAAVALLQLRDPAGREALVQLAQGAPMTGRGGEPTVGFAVAAYAAERLQVEAHLAGRGALLNLMGGNPDIGLLARAGLARLGDPAALRTIRAAAAKGNRIAIRLVGDLGGPEDLPLLKQALASTPAVHRPAVEALAALGDDGPLATDMMGIDLTSPGHRSLTLLSIASRARAKAMLPRFVGLMTHGTLDMRLYAAQLVLRADYPDVP